MKEEILRAIAYYTKQLNSAQVVLDSGFGNNPNESNRLYVKRKEMSKLALTALQEQLDRLDGAERISAGVGITLRIVCSKCKKQVYREEKYCKNCGRKLRGGEDG